MVPLVVTPLLDGVLPRCNISEMKAFAFLAVFAIQLHVMFFSDKRRT